MDYKGEIMTSDKKPKQSNKPVERIMRGQQDVHHDLFRLESATTKKNIAYGASPIWEAIDHKHFFHTVNSDGKPQDKCAPTAGHFHFITVKEENGKFVAECSPPYVMGVVKGRKQAVEYKNDAHTHDVTYLQSELIKQRVMNADAMKEISRIENENAKRMANPL